MTTDITDILMAASKWTRLQLVKVGQQWLMIMDMKPRDFLQAEMELFWNLNAKSHLEKLTRAEIQRTPASTINQISAVYLEIIHFRLSLPVKCSN